MKVTSDITGYSYGSAEVVRSPFSVRDLEELKLSAGFTKIDEEYLQMAGEVLSGQTKQIVDHWRGDIITSIPNLARHSRARDGSALPDYLAGSNGRFQQWIMDTCLRKYDQAWIDYQQEIARRHTTAGKNIVDGVQSTTHVPLRDVISFVAVMNLTIRTYLASKGHPADVVEKMHQAWCKSIQMQISLWIGPYALDGKAPEDW